MPAGKPPKYKTIKELQAKIDEYFASEPKKPTISGLAYFLGFETRQALYHMENKGGELGYTIKKAVLFIENIHEQGLFNPANSGHIFWLKNRNWTDKQELQHSGAVEHSLIKWKPAK